MTKINVEIDINDALNEINSYDLIDELKLRDDLYHALEEISSDKLVKELKNRNDFEVVKVSDLQIKELKTALCDRYGINHHVSILELMGKLLSEFINSNLLDTKIKQ